LIKHTLKDLKPHVDPNTVVMGDFNTPLSTIDRASRQKNQQRNPRKNDNIDLMELTDVYRVFHPATAQYTFFSAAHGTFSKIDHILEYKASLNKHKQIELNLCILSDHNAIKLELNNKSSSKKYSNNWGLINTLLNDQWVIEKIREEIKNYLGFNENENTTYQNLWDTAKAVLREHFIAMSAYTKTTERSQIKNLMLHLKLLEHKNKLNSK
jgi:hypothetical protein